MKIINPTFIISANSVSQFPESTLPEIAFVGRSNVGKSSIINTLLNRKALAKVGATPGKTRLINFFNIDDKFHFVDLPGYGYASVSRDKKFNWAELIEEYLNSRETLKLILMLVDIRHEPSADDQMMYKWIFEQNLPHIIVASKYDKITRSQLKEKIGIIEKTLKGSENTEIIPFSCLKRTGIDEVWSVIEKHLSEDEY